jgi:hypothetical protein
MAERRLRTVRIGAEREFARASDLVRLDIEGRLLCPPESFWKGNTPLFAFLVNAFPEHAFHDGDEIIASMLEEGGDEPVLFWCGTLGDDRPTQKNMAELFAVYAEHHTRQLRWFLLPEKKN